MSKKTIEVVVIAVGDLNRYKRPDLHRHELLTVGGAVNANDAVDLWGVGCRAADQAALLLINIFNDGHHRLANPSLRRSAEMSA